MVQPSPAPPRAPAVLCLSDLLLSAVGRHSHKIALTDGDKSVTYAELDDASDALAAHLASRGVQRSDPIALHLRNCIEYVIADLAILKLCAIKVPLNELMAPDELAYCLDHAGVRVLIRHPSLSRASATPATLQITIDAPERSEETPVCETWRNAMSPQREFVRERPRPEDIALVAYTGGTTGKAKGVVHVQSTLAVNLLAHVVCGDIRSDETMLLTTPLPHSAGYHLQACLLQGGRCVIAQKFEPESFVRTAVAFGATWTFAVPTMIYRLLDHLRETATRIPSLRTFIYGAAPMSLERLEEAIAALGPIFLQIYGQTECPNFISTLGKDDHLDRSLLTSCGRPVPFLTTTICTEDGVALPSGEVGEIRVRSPYNLVAYYRNETATADALVDGALKTGDLAVQDERGYIFLVDRAKDMIITGGMNVYSVEVERVLRTYPSIKDAAVVGIPDPDWGERVVAVITTQSAYDNDGLKAFLRQRLSAYKIPKSIVETGAMPLTAYGKIDKKALRASVADQT